MAGGQLSHTDVHGAARLDDRQHPRWQVQERAAQHQGEPGRRSGGGHGAARGARRAARHDGPDDRHAQPTRLDAAHRTGARRPDRRSVARGGVGAGDDLTVSQSPGRGWG